MEYINGGVTAAKGFKASGIHCGIRKNKTKKDLALIVSDVKCAAAAVYTTNLVKGAPIYVTKEHLANGIAQAVICNSGNANTCVTGGIEVAEEMCKLVEKETGITASDVIVASTGVIGQPLDITPIRTHAKKLVAELSLDGSDAAKAIMTTDTIAKEAAVEFKLNGQICHLGGIAKGSGMINPNMATMLVFLTTDVSITAELLHKAIYEDVKSSFNMVSVDGDTSTNDMLSILANGLAGNATITAEDESYKTFCQALNAVTVKLCKMIAGDGEGATKLLECNVCGAESEKTSKGSCQKRNNFKLA